MVEPQNSLLLLLELDFTSGNYEAFLNGVGTGKNLTMVVSNGEVDTATFQNQDYGSLQPGDKVTMSSTNANGGLGAEITIGGSLTSLAGEFKIGYKNLDKTGAVTQELFTFLFMLILVLKSNHCTNCRLSKRMELLITYEYDYTSTTAH